MQNWSVKFPSGKTLEDEARLRRPRDFDDKVLKSLLESNLWQSTQELKILNTHILLYVLTFRNDRESHQTRHLGSPHTLCKKEQEQKLFMT